MKTLVPSCVIRLVLALSISCSVSSVAQTSTPSYFFTVMNKHSASFMTKELSEQFNFIYKLELRNDTIFPFYCLDSLGSSCFPKIPYMLKISNNNTITVRYFEEALIESETEGDADITNMNYEITLFSLNAKDTVKLGEPIDFPIMFFDDNIRTVYTGDDYILYNNNKYDCYKFKLIDFPVKGYSFIYLEKKNLVPLKYEVMTFASKKKNDTVKEYSSINLYKIE